ncbi:MAG: YidC/Oxa1 family membrane protein insertase [Chloroflexi bacterium]|nr:YidC/Oxa1 family membrane protein insertase [Chloroflexota bacterium]
MIGNIFDLLVVNPMTNILLLLYGLLGQSFVLSIVVLTLLIRLITLPLTFKQQVSAAKMAAMQPRIKEIQEKYKNEPAKVQSELRRIGFSPLSGCLPLVIQFPVLIGLYQAIVRTLSLTPLSLLELGRYVYDFLPNLSQLVPINGTFLGFINLGSTNHTASFYAIPILVVVTTWLSSKVMQAPSADPTTAQTNQMMTMTMPLMIGFFSLSTPIGLGMYWIASNMIGVLQYYVTKPRMDAIKAQYAVEHSAAGVSAAKAVVDAAKPVAAPPRAKVKAKSTGRINQSASRKDKEK